MTFVQLADEADQVSLRIYVQCPGDQVGANKQSSVHAKSFSQNVAPMGKRIPNKTTTCKYLVHT